LLASYDGPNFQYQRSKPSGHQISLPKTGVFHRIPANELSPVVVLVWLPKMSCSLSDRRQLVPSGTQVKFCARFALAALLGTAMLAAPRLRAQSSDSQQNSQDVAEAARQERARKQQAAAERHVYTNDDLHHSKILTADDQARAAAAKEKQHPLTPTAQPEAQPLDANTVTPQEPLGDVARRYRNAKKISPFHLPTNQPELASPKIVSPIPELTPITPAKPQPPARNFVMVRPNAPASSVASPNAPTFPSARAHRIDPFVGRRTEPVAPSKSYERPVAPMVVAPHPSVASPARPAISHQLESQVVVQPGDTLWTISRQHLGRGTRWLELMAANPNLPDPARLVPGTVLSLPAKSTSAQRSRAPQTVTVTAGDTLTKLALTTYGHASYWHCIAQANPKLSNPDRLDVGQVLSLPASCQP
jgi:nucleoid-associated protein YgaU